MNLLPAFSVKSLFKGVFFLMSFFLLLQDAYSQTGDIRGFVYDKETGEAVISANVFLEGTTYGSATNLDGLYSISQVPVGPYTLVSSFIGYDTTRVEIVIEKNKVLNQKLFISESAIMLQGFEMSATREESQKEVQVSTIKLTPKQLSKIPAIGGEPDLAQYLQVIPGVVFTGDQGGQLYIRGGSQIQTKVLLDGMTVYNPFHSIGLFSVFETDIMSNVDVMTGGFNAEYSGRISAAIDISTRDGNKKRMSGKVSANTFLAKALLEGPIKKLDESGDGTTASYIITGKTSYLKQSSKALYDYVDGDEGLPYQFTDLYAKLSLNTSNGSKLNFSGFRFDDKATFQNSSKYGWTSWGLGSKFVMIPGQSKMIIDGHMAYSVYDISLQEADDQPRESSIGGFNGGINFNYFLRNAEVKYGLELSGFTTTFEFFNPLGLKIEENQYTTEIGGFFKTKVELLDSKLVIEPSMRINLYASLPAFKFEPRIGAKWNITNNFRFKFSGGIYTQNFISTKSDRDVVNLFTGFLSAPEATLEDINGENVKDNLQTAFHGITGFEVNIMKGLELNAELYYKGFSQLININRNKLFSSDPNYIVEEGNAYGFDLLLKYDYNRLFMWTVYSLGFVNRDDGNQVYPPHFDRRHNANFMAAYKLGKGQGWELSARWNLGSGFPFTQTQGFYEAVQFTDGIDSDFLEQNGTLGIIYADELNGGRLPYYHRLDLSLKKKWGVGANGMLEASVSVTNVYNRENIFYFDRVRYERVNQLPILPSAGVSFSF